MQGVDFTVDGRSVGLYFVDPGDYFGEIAFLYNSKRSTSVTSTNYTTLGKIPESEIKILFELYPFFK